MNFEADVLDVANVAGMRELRIQREEGLLDKKAVDRALTALLSVVILQCDIDEADVMLDLTLAYLMRQRKACDDEASCLNAAKLIVDLSTELHRFAGDADILQESIRK